MTISGILSWVQSFADEVGFWSGEQDLNLRQSGFCLIGCMLGRLGDAYLTGRPLQRLRLPGMLANSEALPS